VWQVGALTKAIRGDSLNKPVRVDAVVLLSATGITTGKEEAGGGLLGMFSADAAERKTLRSPQREQQVAAAGVPFIVVRVPPFKDVAGSQRVVVAQVMRTQPNQMQHTSRTPNIEIQNTNTATLSLIVLVIWRVLLTWYGSRRATRSRGAPSAASRLRGCS
jgi:hypothetical protein